MLMAEQILALKGLLECSQAVSWSVGLSGLGMNALRRLGYVKMIGTNMFGHPVWKLTPKGEQVARSYEDAALKPETIERSER